MIVVEIAGVINQAVVDTLHSGGSGSILRLQLATVKISHMQLDSG